MLVRAQGPGSAVVSGAKTHPSASQNQDTLLSVGLLSPQTLFNVAGCSTTGLLQTIWNSEKGAVSFPHLSSYLCLRGKSQSLTKG